MLMVVIAAAFLVVIQPDRTVHMQFRVRVVTRQDRIHCEGSESVQVAKSPLDAVFQAFGQGSMNRPYPFPCAS